MLADSFGVHLVDEVGPSVAYVGDVAVVGDVVDQEAYVVVAGLVGVIVVELRWVSGRIIGMVARLTSLTVCI